MSDRISLPEAQIRWIEPYFPLPYGVPRVAGDICDRFIRWSRLGMFNKILASLAAKREPDLK